MRELKFRTWDKEKNKYLLPEKQGFIIVPTSPSFGVTLPYHRGRNFSEDEDCFDWADADLLMGRYELEQYTGLIDKNGKEIYEGDIVEFGLSGRPERGYVAYADEYASFEVYSKRDFIFGCLFGHAGKIIGNIHENPELLGGEE